MEKALEILNLNFTYPDGKQVLRSINLIVYKGDKIGLVGPNGAGKSTLLLHLNGILRSDGAIKILGQQLGNNNLKWVRQRVGLVFQEPDDQLFSPTVFDDIAFGPINTGCSKTEVERLVADALTKVGLIGYESRSPHHLSVGEKKKVAIATVLAMSPEILVLDEPTSNLDPRSKWNLLRLLKTLPLTMIIASHDLEAIQFLCNRIVILDNGRVVADDGTDKIMTDKVLLRSHGLAPS